MLDTRALPVFRMAPTGPGAKLLRRMIAGTLHAVRNPDPTGGKRVLFMLGGHEVAGGTVAGLLARDLIEELAAGDGQSVYALTDSGKRWAAEFDTTTTSEE
jgi:hypothetical protein